MRAVDPRALPSTPLLSKRVRIHGLGDQQAEFNGAFGRALTFKTGTGCYMVAVEGSQAFLELGPANLSDASVESKTEAAVDVSETSSCSEAAREIKAAASAPHATIQDSADDGSTPAAATASGPPCPVCGLPATKRCARCKSVSYCSVKCQRAAWKTHKAECKPDEAPAAPAAPQAREAESKAREAESKADEAPAAPAGPVGGADGGDEEFESMQAYMQAALDIGDRGDLPKEIAMLERAVERDSHQPGACYYLAGAYARRKGEGDLARAIGRMEEAARLLLDPRSQPASEPATVMAGGGLETPSGIEAKRKLVSMVVRDGAKLVGEGVRGLSGAALSGHLALAQRLTELAELADALIDRPLVSHAFHVLGNVQRKMERLEEAIASLRRADAALGSDGHDLVSLSLIPDLLANRAMALSKQEAAPQAAAVASAAGAVSAAAAVSGAAHPKGSWRALLAEAVAEARRVLELAPPASFGGRGPGDFKRCDAQVLLARMLLSELGMTPPAEQRANQARMREQARETLQLAREAQMGATRHGDGRVAALAAKLCQAVQSGQR